MKKLLVVTVALLCFSCSKGDEELQKALDNNDVGFVAARVEQGLKVDGLKFANGHTALGALLSYSSKLPFYKAFSNGTQLVPGESEVLATLLENHAYADLATILKFASGSESLEKQLDYLKKSGFSHDNVVETLADFVFEEGSQSDIDAYVRDFGRNSRFLRQAALKNDLKALSDLVAEIGLDTKGFLAIADSGNLSAIRYALAQKPSLDYDDVIRQSAKTISRDALISMYPLVSARFDYKQFTNDLLAAGNYESASYLINYGATLAALPEEEIDKVAAVFQSKAYKGDSGLYAASDISALDDLKMSLDAMGVSPYLLLRNEIFSRHGYISVNPVLARLNNKLTWYKPIGNVTANDLSSTEQKNILFLKSREQEYDAGIVVQWLNDKAYEGDEKYYITEEDYQLPAAVRSSLTNLGINPAFLLRSDIYARHGYTGLESKVKALFVKTVWYNPTTDELPEFPTTDGDAGDRPGYEYANVQLLQSREWIEVLDSQKQHLPDGIRAIPILGLNTVYLKEITPSGRNEGTFFLSSPTQSLALDASDRLLQGLTIGIPVDGYGINDDVAKQIQETEDPVQALQLFFENKKYAGIADTYIYTESNLADVPSYLQGALDKLGLSWPFILRTEIHARHGATFNTDTTMGQVFSGVTWYQPRYQLVSTTLSRLPSSKSGTQAEILNFALMEGYDFHHALLEAGPHAAVVFDAAGHVHFIKMVQVDADFVRHHLMNEGLQIDPFFSASSFSSLDDLRSTSVQDTLSKMISASLPPVPEAYYDEGKCGG